MLATLLSFRAISWFTCDALHFQIPPAIEQRGVFYKQSQQGFYPTSCEVVADTFVNTVLTVCAT